MKPLVYKKRRRLHNQAKPRIKLHVTKGDMVQVISGEDKGKRARVLRANPKTGREDYRRSKVPRLPCSARIPTARNSVYPFQYSY